GPDDGAVESDIVAEAAVAEVDGEIAVAGVQRKPIFGLVLQGAEQLPIDLGGTGADIPLGLKRGTAAQHERDVQTDNGIDPGLAAAALADGKGTCKSALCIQIPEPSPCEQGGGAELIVDEAIGTAERPDYLVELHVGVDGNRAPRRSLLVLQTKKDEIGESREVVIADLAGDHDRWREPIDALEDVRELNADVDGRQIRIDADLAVQPGAPEVRADAE